MARGRIIDRRLGKSKKFASLKFDRSRVLYCLIYAYTDREGRFSGDPEEIKTECCPYLKYSIKKIAESIIDLTKVELLVLYEDSKTFKPVIQFTAFQKFQNIRKDREAISAYSRPPAKGQEDYRTTPALYLTLSLTLMNELNKEEEVVEIYFNFKKRKFFNITIEDKAGWLDAYQACDINQELSKMREWLLANPSKKKKNYRRFITNWLSRAQEKGGTKINYRTSQVGKDSGDHKTKYPSNFLHRVYGVLNKQKKDQNKYADIIFSLSDEEAKEAVGKYNKSPTDFIKFLEEDFKIKIKGDQE